MSPPGPARPDASRSKVLRQRGDFRWRGVRVEPYEATTATRKGTRRIEPAGRRGGSCRCQLRYFEVDPGGHTTLQRHEHEHVVVPQRDRGAVRIGRRTHRLGFGDVACIAPRDAHQFREDADAVEPFGLPCIVDAARDRPRQADGPGARTICG